MQHLTSQLSRKIMDIQELIIEQIETLLQK